MSSASQSNSIQARTDFSHSKQLQAGQNRLSPLQAIPVGQKPTLSFQAIPVKPKPTSFISSHSRKEKIDL
jgi:hypothetical protein